MRQIFPTTIGHRGKHRVTDATTSLAEKIGSMEQRDGLTRGGAAAVVSVGTGEVLALASYPTYDLIFLCDLTPSVLRICAFLHAFTTTMFHCKRVIFFFCHFIFTNMFSS